MHILVAEDNHVNQKLLQKIISALEFTFAITWNGREALDYLANPLNHRPNVILLDLAMPVIGGPEVLETIRTQRPFIDDPILQNTPIVVMTASGMPLEAQRWLNLGASDVIVKPIRRKHLQAVLMRWSRREFAPLDIGGMGHVVRPVWGPMPLRKYRGPRSLL